MISLMICEGEKEEHLFQVTECIIAYWASWFGYDVIKS
jgi:hypothetical protein